MDDTIRRQAVIDTLRDMWCKSDEDGYVWIIRSDAWARIDALPAVEPEIIRCENCKYVGTDATYSLVCKREGMGLRPYCVDHDDYCSYAERRQDE